MGLKVVLKNLEVRSWGGYTFVKVLRFLYAFFCKRKLSDKQIAERKFEKVFGHKLDLTHPKTLNEKIQWLKLYDREDFYTMCADKYAVRNYFKGLFGEEYLIPLLFVTDNWTKINSDNIIDFPCIVKANHTSGDYFILRSPADVKWNELRLKCRMWLDKDFYKISQEWQYKNIKRKIVVEKLLQTKSGRIPNDYKLHYINGELQFVYVSVDREGGNKRNIYDSEWKPLYFSWVESTKDSDNIRGEEIDAPDTFEKMKEFGEIIAKNFKYVRVDFYDVDGKLYFGEITLHHGSGYDVFVPEEYDLEYGKLLRL